MELPRSNVPSVEGVIPVPTLEVKLTVSVVASPKITLPLKVDVPLTVRLSLTLVVPPLLSMVRLPVEVSIVLSLAIPIRILSM